MSNQLLTAKGKGYCVEIFNSTQNAWHRQCPPDFDFASELDASNHAKRQIEMPLALKGKIAYHSSIFRVCKSA